MAGGIDWFRWHHGSVSDPKFQLVAKKAGASVAEVIAVWACLLESASQAAERGQAGEQDFEAMDCALGLQDGKSLEIFTRMTERNLLDTAGKVSAWDKRQPKREDDSAASRKQRQRERNREEDRQVRDMQHGPQSHAESREVTQNHDRGEESREEKENTPPAPKGVCELPPGFARFWQAWPKSERKQSRGECVRAWRRAGAESVADTVVAHVEQLKASDAWQRDGGRYIPAPLVYLNQRRWDGAEASANDDPYGLKAAL
jgi:hypothetical protein